MDTDARNTKVMNRFDVTSRLIAKLEHENAQLKKSLFGARTERSKMPRVKTGEPATP